MKGFLEGEKSAQRNAAVVQLRRKNTSYNVFQSQRRGIGVRDIEKGPDYSARGMFKSNDTKDVMALDDEEKDKYSSVLEAVNEHVKGLQSNKTSVRS